MKEDIIQGYKLGADDYITKPFDSEVLLHKIKAILKRNEELHRKKPMQNTILANIISIHACAS
jgi:two-component system OmpR family response regulator